MAGVGADIKFNIKDFENLHKVSAKKAEKAVRRTANLIEASAIKKAPDVTTNLINMIGVEFSGDGFNIEGRIISHAPYSQYVHEGTGIFGPTGMPIFPTEKQALWWPGAAHPVKMIRGQKPQPFLRDAMEEEGPKLYQRVFE